MKIKEVIRCVYMLKQQPDKGFRQKGFIIFILANYDCSFYVAEKVSNFFNFIYKNPKNIYYERTN